MEFDVFPLRKPSKNLSTNSLRLVSL